MIWHRFRKPNVKGRPRLVLPEDGFAAIYAISDIHGCYREFVEAEQRIYSDGEMFCGPKLIVLLGDYVDRGPDSRSLLERLCSPVAEGYVRVALAGNHDDEFARMCRQPAVLGDWINFAGIETLASYGIDVEATVRAVGLRGLHKTIDERIEEQHIAFIEALPVSLQIGKLLFVHAGVRPGLDLTRQTDTDLMWIREPFLSEGPRLPLFVIHGHTPVPEPTLGRQRLAIDTGVAATGVLSILKIAGGEITFL